MVWQKCYIFSNNEDRWCGWHGELSDLEHHVQSCPMRDTPLMTELLESSLYVNIIIIFNRDNVNGVIIYR